MSGLTMLEKQFGARIIVGAAKAKDSNPWRLDEVLKALEQAVIHDGTKSPKDFAEICNFALPQIQDRDDQILVELGVLTGLRKSDDTAEEARDMFIRTGRAINSLPGGSRKEALELNRAWQVGVFLSRLGGFEAASAAHRTLASSEAKPKPDRAVSKYLSLFYTVCEQLVKGTAASIDHACCELEKALPVLLEATVGTNQQVWGRCNGTMHLLQAWIFAGRPREAKWDKVLAHFNASSSGWGPRNTAWARLFAAIDNIEALRAIAASSNEDDAMCARLLLARWHVLEGRTGDARMEYGLITAVPNGHMIYSVAQRELAALGD